MTAGSAGRTNVRNAMPVSGVRVEMSDAPVIDVVFAIAGTTLPVEHAYELWRETVRVLPWLADEVEAGIHPLKTSPGGEGIVLIARRTKLVLRVPRRRAQDALALSGQALRVGAGLAVGAGAERHLRPWATLHAQRVATDAGDDAGFGDEVARWLAARAVDCEFITGRRRMQCAGDRKIRGYSVVLHGVRPADSLRVQCEGMGGDRALGWGIFIPHKSIAAVG